jgi:hypothetical protein
LLRTNNDQCTYNNIIISNSIKSNQTLAESSSYGHRCGIMYNIIAEIMFMDGVENLEQA